MSETRDATDRRSAVTLESDQRRHVNIILGVAAAAILLLWLDSAFAQDTSFGQRLFQGRTANSATASMAMDAVILAPRERRPTSTRHVSIVIS